MELTSSGWLFLTTSWAFVIGLTLFSFKKALGEDRKGK